ncbi:MAG: enoyl-CoA hydratase/isomerase family protein, partial [Alphaproteobacteria bacterium]|nr:enoyl-CoA hydratase/isomerase family protein [Alphaproteobacteria bacterium]
MADAAKKQAESENILPRHDEDGICRLTLNRPQQYNALSEAMLDALQGAFDEIAEDKSVRVVIIGGAGKAFCAGHDLKEMRANPSRDYYEHLFAKCGRMMT